MGVVVPRQRGLEPLLLEPVPGKGAPTPVLPCHQAQVLLHRDGGGQAWTFYGEVGFPCGKLDGRESLPLALLPAGACVAATCRALRASVMVGGGAEGVEGVEGDGLVPAEDSAAPGAGHTLSLLHRLMAAHSF